MLLTNSQKSIIYFIAIMLIAIVSTFAYYEGNMINWVLLIIFIGLITGSAALYAKYYTDETEISTKLIRAILDTTPEWNFKRNTVENICPYCMTTTSLYHTDENGGMEGMEHIVHTEECAYLYAKEIADKRGIKIETE